MRCAVVRVARQAPPPPTLDFTDLRLAVAGGADSGKTTLIGVLTSGAGGAPALDNGRGSSRMQVGVRMVGGSGEGGGADPVSHFGRCGWSPSCARLKHVHALLPHPLCFPCLQVFRHKHEVLSGQTSCISLRTLAYDAQGGCAWSTSAA